jgi:hypothetical protein
MRVEVEFGTPQKAARGLGIDTGHVREAHTFRTPSERSRAHEGSELFGAETTAGEDETAVVLGTQGDKDLAFALRGDAEDANATHAA